MNYFDNHFKGTLVLTAALLALANLSGCAKDEAPPLAPEKSVSVSTTAAKIGVVNETVFAIADAKPLRDSLISTDVVGRIQMVKKEGTWLSSGDVIAVLYSDRVAASAATTRAQLVSARVDLEQKKRDLVRMKRLEAAGAVARQDFENAQSALELSQAHLAAAKAISEEAEVALRERVIYAPFSGTVLDKKVETGEVVSPGTPIVRFGDISSLEIVATVSEREAVLIKKGAAAIISFDAFPGDTFNAKVSSVHQALTPGSRTAKVKLLFRNTKTRFPAGLLARVTITARSKNNILYVPTSTIRDDPDGYCLWVIKDNRANRRKVELGIRGIDSVEIISGLKKDESVVVRGSGELREGQLVESSSL